MVAITFKSVGELISAKKYTEKVVNTKPLGIRTPLRFGNSNDGIFAMHFESKNQIRDNLRNLLLTNKGERLALPDFGGNLLSLVFEMSTVESKEDFDNKLMINISEAAAKYMPFLKLQSFESEQFPDSFENSGQPKVRLRLVYDIPSLRVTDQALEMILYVGG